MTNFIIGDKPRNETNPRKATNPVMQHTQYAINPCNAANPIMRQTQKMILFCLWCLSPHDICCLWGLSQCLILWEGSPCLPHTRTVPKSVESRHKKTKPVTDGANATEYVYLFSICSSRDRLGSDAGIHINIGTVRP